MCGAQRSSFSIYYTFHAGERRMRNECSRECGFFSFERVNFPRVFGGVSFLEMLLTRR